MKQLFASIMLYYLSINVKHFNNLTRVADKANDGHRLHGSSERGDHPVSFLLSSAIVKSKANPIVSRRSSTRVDQVKKSDER
jgi:hypothetical protein